LWCCSFLLAELVGIASATSAGTKLFPSGYEPSYWRNHLLVVDDDRGKRKLRLRSRFFALRHGQSEGNVAGVIASDPEIARHRYGLSPTGFDQAKAAGAKLVADFLEGRGGDDEEAATKNKKRKGKGGRFPPPKGILIVCSDFKRAHETAGCVAKAVAEHNENLPRDRRDADAIPLYSWSPGSASIVGTTKTSTKSGEDDRFLRVDAALRERWFGEWDGGSDVHYEDVWKDDAANPYHTVRGVESVWSVLDRATRLVRSVDDAVSRSCLDDDDDDDDGCLWIVCVAHGDVLQILQTAFGRNLDPSKHRSLDHLETATLRPFE